MLFYVLFLIILYVSVNSIKMCICKRWLQNLCCNVSPKHILLVFSWVVFSPPCSKVTPRHSSICMYWFLFVHSHRYLWQNFHRMQWHIKYCTLSSRNDLICHVGETVLPPTHSTFPHPTPSLPHTHLLRTNLHLITIYISGLRSFMWKLTEHPYELQPVSIHFVCRM